MCVEKCAMSTTLCTKAYRPMELNPYFVKNVYMVIYFLTWCIQRLKAPKILSYQTIARIHKI